ncbi:LD-carboxypeptidase [bacterium]|nr:LD-carboxypeptidase [bacterium]
MKKAKQLRDGDIIGIAASASPFEKDKFLAAVEHLRSKDYKVFYKDDIFEKKNYLAGNDARRAKELLSLLSNKKINALFFARGGYGMMRILPFVDKMMKPSHPKIVMGYSDITPLLNYLTQKKKWITFYGPVVAKDLTPPVDLLTEKTLFQTLTGIVQKPFYQFDETVCLKKGRAQGMLTGGCLSLIISTLATPYELDTTNKILFFEDINEKPYAVDRMLTQLKLAGKLKKAKGIIFGNFVNGGENEHYIETIKDVLKDFKGPVLYNFPAGHGAQKVTLAFGAKVELNATNKTLKYLESPLE